MSSNRYSKRRTVDTKINKLTPNSRAVDVKAKVVSKGEAREVTSRKDGSSHRVCDVVIGDETGTVILSLWNEDIVKVREGDTVEIGNGYVKTFRGKMRLNVGKYGTLKIAEEPLKAEVNTENKMSERDYGGRRPYR
ncbi:MAG: single-stranded DNA-binding protein [Thermoproteota archaeon]